MASAFRKNVFYTIYRRSLIQQRTFSSDRNVFSRCLKHSKVVIAGLSTASFICLSAIYAKRNGIQVLHAGGEEDSEKKKTSPTYREMRFLQFASVEYKGVIYMTPQDFLESVTEEMPRPRIGRASLTDGEVAGWLKRTPNRRYGSTKLFRNLHDKGLISYTEYLFLLCVLTKSKSGFRIAFNMFDTDGNQIVDKKEFLVLESVFSKKEDAPNNEDPLSKSVEPVQDTTLLVHFFGSKGRDVLKYEDFHSFMENLQSEVIELEFLEFSRGLATISEEDFARILLRYTMLDSSNIEECIKRVRSRTPSEKGVSFEEFRKFCQFLNTLDDFSIAMKMYTYADQAVSKEDFQRAVFVCTGSNLSPHLVDTVFNIFDADGDGHLSYMEFISIMKDRLHRGSRSHLMHTQDKWTAFKYCIKNEMRTYH
ncbi:calcium uptake protein 3, mitochondrial-like isoform X3 [Crassostrea angulata]|uniref:calcium uptake protein 3, mitochondrial-like isoform X3 n=1 Tax=Magallana angulata TaxID=2784310 RepID=UPI0022B09B84|nr:calcium uptake protein 3, mitochondrial-like isoform X3 [Crassostrea angulata]